MVRYREVRCHERMAVWPEKILKEGGVLSEFVWSLAIGEHPMTYPTTSGRKIKIAKKWVNPL